jgi:hypothetical protein
MCLETTNRSIGDFFNSLAAWRQDLAWSIYYGEVAGALWVLKQTVADKIEVAGPRFLGAMIGE